MNKYIEEIIKESELSASNLDIPIGAIVVKDDQIIGRGHNTRIAVPDVTNHAEIIAIREAEKHINDWRLDGCDLYVTLYPCDMCIEIIKAARINNVYYLLEKDNKNKSDYTNFNLIDDNVSRETYRDKLSSFFKDNIR
jgi:tRNA(adenine34) deaminase